MGRLRDIVNLERARGREDDLTMGKDIRMKIFRIDYEHKAAQGCVLIPQVETL